MSTLVLAHDDSHETVEGPTDKETDSDVDADADMAGPTNIDDDLDGDEDDPSPHPEHHVIGVPGMPCDPPVTQKDVIRLDAGDQGESETVSLSEGGKRTWGE